MMLLFIILFCIKKILNKNENMQNKCKCIKSNYDIDINLLFSEEPYKLKNIQKICNLSRK